MQYRGHQIFHNSSRRDFLWCSNQSVLSSPSIGQMYYSNTQVTHSGYSFLSLSILAYTPPCLNTHMHVASSVIHANLLASLISRGRQRDVGVRVTAKLPPSIHSNDSSLPATVRACLLAHLLACWCIYAAVYLYTVEKMKRNGWGESNSNE